MADIEEKNSRSRIREDELTSSSSGSRDLHTLFSSMLPNYDGSRTRGSDIFIGCWESVDGGVWLEIYENGEYLYMWDDGYGASGDFAMEGSTLVLQTGTRYTYDSSTDRIKGDDYVMFRSQMPAHLRP